jgi:threonine/homoserine/homoserine lactone efflux protein
MTIDQWLPFLLLCIAMELTPGPNMAYLAILTISVGRRAGFFAIAGIALGLAIIGALSVFGVAVIVSSSRLLSHLLAAAGFTYLLWLAWDTWREPKGHAMQPLPMLYQQYFLRGLVTNLLNPKAFLFYVAVLPGFIGGNGQALSSALLLTGISVVVASSVHTLIVLLAGKGAGYLAATHRQRSVRRLMALLLVGLALWFAIANSVK